MAIIKESLEINIYMTSPFPKKSSIFSGYGGSFLEGEVLHLAQIGNVKLSRDITSRNIIAISFDMVENKIWGPFQVGSIWNPDFLISKMKNLDLIKKYIPLDIIRPFTTKAINGLPICEWRKIFLLLDQIRETKICDDTAKAFISELILKINKILENTFKKSVPGDDVHYSTLLN
jgi:hypothetical protein